MNVYNELENKELIRKINECFYEKVYAHPWLSLYFQTVPQEHITTQQTDFITSALGGPNMFCGRNPSVAHPHMMITDELFDLRKSLLSEAFEELNAPTVLVEAWFRIETAFRRTIVKKSKDECKGRWVTDPIIDFSVPPTK